MLERESLFVVYKLVLEKVKGGMSVVGLSY